MMNENEIQQLQNNITLMSTAIQNSPALAASISHSLSLFIEKNPEIMEPLFSATSRGWILSFTAAIGEKPLANFLTSCRVPSEWNNITVFLFKLGTAFGGWWLDGTMERRLMNVAITNAIFICAFAYWSKTHPHQLADGTRLQINERNQIIHYKSTAVTVLGSAITRQLIQAHFFSKTPLTVEKGVEMFLGVLGSIGGSALGFGLGKATMWAFSKLSDGFSCAVVKTNSCASRCYNMFPSAIRRYMPVPNNSRYSDSYEMRNFRGV